MKYTSRQRRLLEMAGILRPNTPDWMLLTEGDDEEDPFADDGDDGGDEGGDDSGGDDLFGDDSGDGDDGDDGEEEAEEPEEPAEELEPQDIKKYGTPMFHELEQVLVDAFESAKKAGPVRSEEIATYPGAPSDDEDEVEASLAEDEPEDENTQDDGSKEESEETDAEEVKKEFRNYKLNRREFNILVESKRLLREANEADTVSSEEFDMQMFAHTISDLIQHKDSKFDLPGAIYNGARQMVLNGMGKEGEIKFIEIFDAVCDPSVKEILGIENEADYSAEGANIPTAVGASGGSGGAV